ncbi:MAG: fumarate hydratase [Dehalococcoidia bacterium]|nr:fumarate hydratase [Dehalococcoidia bacterium]
MREINTREITSTVARLCQEANFFLPEDVQNALKQAWKKEESPTGRSILGKLLENASIAADEKTPLCQDTGVAVIFIELGQEVHIVGGNLIAAVNEGVRRGYEKGYLRKSMVNHPFSSRINTGDNTPAVIHTETVSGDHLKITALPKGAGSENMTRLAMLTPAQGRQGIIDFVIETVDKAGGNPCPPIIVGVGIGGTAEKTLLLAKKALMRRVGEPSPDPEIAQLEKELLERINNLGIGPQGLGGRITAMAVQIEVFPSHIASMPVAVNLQCHSARHKEAVL